MTTTNRSASEAMRNADAEAATDVTGFGLLGHLHRMLEASGVAAELEAGAIPLMDPRILELARRDVVPGGTKRNLAYVRAHTDFGDLPEPEQLILADAQTSGGLLIAAKHKPSMEAAFAEHDVPFARIGTVVAGDPGRITVAGSAHALAREPHPRHARYLAGGGDVDGPKQPPTDWTEEDPGLPIEFGPASNAEYDPEPVLPPVLRETIRRARDDAESERPSSRDEPAGVPALGLRRGHDLPRLERLHAGGTPREPVVDDERARRFVRDPAERLGRAAERLRGARRRGVHLRRARAPARVPPEPGAERPELLAELPAEGLR